MPRHNCAVCVFDHLIKLWQAVLSLTYLLLEDDVCGGRFFGREGPNASCLALLFNPGHLLVEKFVADGLQLIRLANHLNLFFVKLDKHVFCSFLS